MKRILAPADVTIVRNEVTGKVIGYLVEGEALTPCPVMPTPASEPVADPSWWTYVNRTGYTYAGPHDDYCRCSVQCGKGDWHTQPIGSEWRWRDKLARLLRYHCWDCWRRA